MPLSKFHPVSNFLPSPSSGNGFAKGPTNISKSRCARQRASKSAPAAEAFAQRWFQAGCTMQNSRCVAKEQFAQIVKDYAERVGLDPALYAGHSMRAGFLTSAAKRGA
jgi:hypothetical protein